MEKENKGKNAEIYARIKEIIEDLKLSPNAFALKLNYKRAQTVYDILNGKSAPSYDFFNRFMLSEFSETYNMNWLLTGRGSMYLPHIGTAMEMGETNILDQIVGVQLRELQAVADTSSQLAKLNGELAAKAALIDSYLDKIVHQAQEIGELKEKLRQAQQEIEELKATKNATTSHHAPTPAPAVP